MTAALQKIAVHAVLELCTHSKYQHMRLELLFHVVCLIFASRYGSFSIVQRKVTF